MASSTLTNIQLGSKVLSGRSTTFAKKVAAAPLRQRSKSSLKVTASESFDGASERRQEVSMKAQKNDIVVASQIPAVANVEAESTTVWSAVKSVISNNWKTVALFGVLFAGVSLLPLGSNVIASGAVDVGTVAEVVAPVFDSGDTAWMMTSACLVLFMTIPGLSLFYGGLVGKKNVLSILMICMTLTCVMTLIWVAFGYSLAFTGSGALIGTLDKAFLNGVTAMSPAVETIPEPLWVMFQATFCIITPALIVGSFAERMKFSALLIFTILWGITTYIPFCHMVWGGGYLEGLGLLDFAGGIVVHLTAGASALLACIMVGPRKSPAVAPHNLPMVITGTGMLWVGWFGFNAGSAVAANGGAAMAMIATQVCAATAGFVWMMLDWIQDGKPTTLGLCCGVVAGLVAVTPGAGFVSPLGAMATGVLAGFICRWASTSAKKMFGYDDALDVWGVHGVGGFLGNQTTAIFGATAFGGTEVVASVAKQFGVHLYASCFAIAWSMAATFVILKLLDLTIGLRPTEAGETEGLDMSDHGEEGYIM